MPVQVEEVNTSIIEHLETIFIYFESVLSATHLSLLWAFCGG